MLCPTFTPIQKKERKKVLKIVQKVKSKFLQKVTLIVISVMPKDGLSDKFTL